MFDPAMDKSAAGTALLSGDGVTVFETPLFLPRYVPITAAEWSLVVTPFNLSRGYWSGVMLVRDMAALYSVQPDGRAVTWMSITPMELESQEIGCLEAAGHTVVMGLGMGWAAASTALNPAVTRVTVVERNRPVLALHETLRVFDQLPDWARAKITVVEGDALEWRPSDGPVDFLMPDIWQPLVNPGRTAEVRRMRDNTGAARVYFWGQEMVLAALARDRLGVPVDAIDADTIAQAVAMTGLPLVGTDGPDLPDRLRRAARQWLRPPGEAPMD